jgi:hypothetical protein
MVFGCRQAVAMGRTGAVVAIVAMGLLSLFGSTSPPPSGGGNQSSDYAEAGRSRNAKVGQEVRLDASGTTKKETFAAEDTFTVQWTLTSAPDGSAAAIASVSDVVTTFTPDVPGQYTFAAEAGFPSASGTDSDPVTIDVTDETENAPPNAHAGPVQVVEQGERVELDGRRSVEPDLEANGFRPRPNSLVYRWDFRAAPGLSFPALTGEQTPNATFVASRAGEYVLDLEASDWDWNAEEPVVDRDPVLILARAPGEMPDPMPDAGPDQHVKTGSTVTLDGRGSRDAQNNPLAYAWEITHRPPASQATLDDPASPRPTFTADREGQYLVELVVSNNAVSSRDLVARADIIEEGIRDQWEYADRVLVIADTDNSRPVAAVGPDQRVLTGTEVVVDGSGSSDADGDVLEHDWYFVSTGDSFGLTPPAISTSPDGSLASFTPTHAGTHVLRLRVSDGSLTSRPVTSLITVKDSNNPPLADAGKDAIYNSGVEAQLDGGASTDPDGDPLSYAWRIDSKPSGSSAVLSEAEIRNPRLTLDEPGDYDLTLTVSDGIAQDFDSITLTVLAGTGGNQPPVADAGDDRTELIEGPTQILLDGSGSYDPDNDAITYAWTQIAGPNVTLSESTAAEPSFEATELGTYTFQLIVSDGSLSSNADQVAITVADGSVNQQPVADAGDDMSQVLEGPTPVELDGTGSFDPDGDTLSYNWSQIGGPAVALSDPNAARPTFTPTMDGEYTFRLVVNDGQVDSNPDAVTVGIEFFIP